MLLSLFCVRLAAGLAASLLLLSPAQVNPRFYCTHFLILLGLAVVALAIPSEVGWAPLLGVAAGLVLCLAGSIVWSLEGAPGGRIIVMLTAVCLGVALGLLELQAAPEAPGWGLAAGFTSAALLGSATTAMLLGHSYLIAPSMSISPLLRLLAALFAAIAARLVVSGLGFWFWTEGHSLLNLEDETVLWLPIRWGLGLAGPLVLGWMAFQTARIRSTQSATGILYVVVIFCFLGELLSLLLSVDGDIL
jgi:hypothetical protein